MAELLLELLSEEIPARMQARAADDLKRLAGDGLKAAGLAFTKIETYVTPRRLVLVVDGLPVKQADVEEEKRGPRVDAPEQAVQGFLRANNVALDQCEKRKTEKGEFWFTVVRQKGRTTADALKTLLPAIIVNLSWPKSMRWGSGKLRWVRPLSSILCLFDERVVDFTLEPKSLKEVGSLAGIQTLSVVDSEKRHEILIANKTVGHRFLAPQPFEVKDFADYKKKLKAAKVVLDAAERRAIIERDATALARAHGLTFAMDEGLMNEVAGLVEWPVVLMGSIDKAFMDLPPEVLTVSMRQHQKYFRLDDADGNIAPRFVVVANMETADGGKTVIAGNERVLRARLSDAQFFWDQDRKTKLGARIAALNDRVFHANLGTDFDRTDRIRRLAVRLAQNIPGADAAVAERAALLCKADLTTGMVGEFPELQGTMGNYYAINDGEPMEVAMAIADHYSPVGPNDSCPTAPVSVAVALADKIDTLAGFFAIDEKPTGSKDPFALRRAALGVIRLIVENQLRVSLLPIFVDAAKAHNASSDGKELMAFFADRLKVALKDKGVRHDLIDAVFALGGEDDLVRLLARVEALGKFLATDDGANLLVAFRRAANILKIEEKKDGKAYDGAVDPAKLSQAEEKALADGLAVAEAAIRASLEQEDFAGAMTALAALRAPVDAFFDKVTVNADDPALRANRLRLLARIRAALGGVADFSRIEG